VPLSVIAGLALLVASLALRGATLNRHIRGRLILSASLFAAFTAAAIAIRYLPLADETIRLLRDINPLVMTFAVINLVVAFTLNPWRIDRIPDRFPNIVQDTLVMGLFALVATLILRDRMLATTAVGAVVIGLALQDTLGNFFAGLAIQVEKPFRVGDWVTIGGQDGIVSEITWRATKMRNKAGNFVVVPNSTLAKDTIINYCQPTRSVRLQVDVGASYEVAPNVVKGVIVAALQSAPEILHERAPEVLLVDFGNSSMLYRVHFWVTDFDPDDRVPDRVRTLIYYAFKRNNITIPYPIQVEMSAEEGGVVPVLNTVAPDALASVPLFSPLAAAERAALLAVARPVRYAAGEAIVRQGQTGKSLFIILHGEATVTLAGTSGEVARLRDGAVFGEMSLLTGEARTATVTAATDCDVLEIEAEGFRAVVMSNPSVLEHVTGVTATRRQELDRHRETHTAVASIAEAKQSLLDRVRQFLRL
jgi:small-conductance mechanosensitive channel/CRP-like cAMP-binding protein